MDVVQSDESSIISSCLFQFLFFLVVRDNEIEVMIMHSSFNKKIKILVSIKKNQFFVNKLKDDMRLLIHNRFLASEANVCTTLKTIYSMSQLEFLKDMLMDRVSYPRKYSLKQFS